MPRVSELGLGFQKHGLGVPVIILAPVTHVTPRDQTKLFANVKSTLSEPSEVKVCNKFDHEKTIEEAT